MTDAIHLAVLVSSLTAVCRPKREIQLSKYGSLMIHGTIAFHTSNLVDIKFRAEEAGTNRFRLCVAYSCRTNNHHSDNITATACALLHPVVHAVCDPELTLFPRVN